MKVQIEWLPNGEDESIPRCPNCGLTGLEISDIAELWAGRRFCYRCEVELEIENEIEGTTSS